MAREPRWYLIVLLIFQNRPCLKITGWHSTPISLPIFSDSFIKEGGKIVAEESFSSGNTDYRSQLTKIKEANPDVIIIAARKEFPIILKQKN